MYFLACKIFFCFFQNCLILSRNDFLIIGPLGKHDYCLLLWLDLQCTSWVIVIDKSNYKSSESPVLSDSFFVVWE